MDGRPPVSKPEEADGMDTELSEEEQKRAQEEEAVKANIQGRWGPRIDGLKRGLANVWIAEMQFACRAEVRPQQRLRSLAADHVTTCRAWPLRAPCSQRCEDRPTGRVKSSPLPP